MTQATHSTFDRRDRRKPGCEQTGEAFQSTWGVARFVPWKCFGSRFGQRLLCRQSRNQRPLPGAAKRFVRLLGRASPTIVRRGVPSGEPPLRLPHLQTTDYCRSPVGRDRPVLLRMRARKRLRFVVRGVWGLRIGLPGNCALPQRLRRRNQNHYHRSVCSSNCLLKVPSRRLLSGVR